MLGHLGRHWMPLLTIVSQCNRAAFIADTHLPPLWSNRVQPSPCKPKARRDFARHHISSKARELLVKLFDAVCPFESSRLVTSGRSWELRELPRRLEVM